eukprot:s4590_g4.t1
MYLPVLLVVLRFLAFKTIELCIQSHPLLIHISYMCRIIEVERFLPSGLSAFSLAFKTIELCIQSHPLLIHISYMCRIIEVERFLPSGLSAFSLTSGGQLTEPGIGKFRGSNF